jgi:glycyl-tRNA synthetase beta chain
MRHETLLIEIGTEELPPKSLMALKTAFAENLRKALDDRQFNYGKVTAFATPRRLAVQIAACENLQPEQLIQKKGPKLSAAFDNDGQPTKALSGFLKSCGITDPDLLEREETEKGAWVVYRSTQAGATLSSEIQAILIEATATLPIAKRMRWQSYRAEFVRPVRWLVALYGNEILNCHFHDRTADAKTYGHRAMYGDDPIILSHADDYEAGLEAGFVIVSFEKRQALISEQLEAAASVRGAIASDDPALLEEVTALTEWPRVLGGDFDPAFLAVPEEALISAMREHQRYFHLRDNAGQLQPNFLTVANLESLQPEEVVAGNERVIRPRLTDAQFFYNKDLQKPLEDALDQLNQVVFQNALGSFGDKARRISTLSGLIAKSLGENEAVAARAGLLAKTDLVSLMVGEFPELQGIMGSYYAKAQGESSRTLFTPIFGRPIARHNDRLCGCDR